MADQALKDQQDTIVVPVYDAPNTRTYNSGAGLYFEQSYINNYPEAYKVPGSYSAPTMNAVKRAGTLATAAMTPTIASYASASSDSLVCLCNMVVTQLYDVYVAAFFDSNNSKIYIIQYRPIALTTTKIGEITGCNINDMVFITEIINGDTLIPAIAISYQKSDKSSGTGLYALSLAGVFPAASLVTIASGSFPSNLATPKIITGPFQQMNGTTYIMTVDGSIYNSGLTVTNGRPDITSWNTLAFVSATQYPDRGVGVYRYKHLLIAAGQDSLEFWSDDNNAPPSSPLVRTDQAFIKFGAASPKLVINIDDILYWVSYGTADTIGIWKLDGYAPTKISGQKENALLMNSVTVGAYPPYFSLEACLINSKKHLICNSIASYSLLYVATNIGTVSSTDTFPVNATTEGKAGILCYSVDDGIWWAMNMLNNSNCAIHPTTAYPSNLTAGQYAQYFFRRGVSSTGNDQVSSTRPMSWVINGAEGTFYDDNPTAFTTLVPITCVVTFNTIWNQTTKRKSLRQINAMIDTLTRAGGDSNTYNIYFLYNKSGNSTVAADTNIRALPFVTQNTTNIASRYSVNNFGMYRQINLAFVFKSRDALRMQGLELVIAGGSS